MNEENYYHYDFKIYMNGRKLSAIKIDKKTAVQISKLAKKIFCYETSCHDEMAFKSEIVKYLKGLSKPTLSETARCIIYKINDGGLGTKYMYFNNEKQKLYVDRDVMEWFTLVAESISSLPYLHA